MFSFLTKKFSNIFSSLTGKDHLSEGNLETVLASIEESLIQADVPYELAKQLLNEVKRAVLGQKVLGSLKPNEQFIKIFHTKLKEFLGGSSTGISLQIPSIVMLMGLQGSGKTTTIVKLAHYYRDQALKKGKNREILLASVDFYRPAAVDQLEVLAKQAGVDFYRAIKVDPVAAAVEIYEHFKAQGYEYLFLDTAGRLHVDGQMLQELREIDERIEPKYKFLVLDAMTGQESLKVAQAFEQTVGFNGAVLSKMDSDALGGAALSFRYMLKKPIYFMGMGEKFPDLELFYADRIADRLIGMGDLQTLMEQAQAKIKVVDQEKALDALKKGRFTLDDFSQQLEMVSKMGPLSSLMQYLPGVNTASVTPDMVEKGDREMRKFRAIMSSMTHKERIVPQILDQSRKGRIAKGAGASVHDVNYLLQKFEQSAQFVKLFKKQGHFKNMFRS